MVASTAMPPAFDKYMEDFTSAHSDALIAVEAVERCTDAITRDDLAGEARGAIDEIERYIRVLESEAQNEKNSSVKRKMTQQTIHCKTQCASLTSSLEKAMLLGDARGRKVGSANAVDRTAANSNAPKEQIVRVAERIDRTGRHLDDAQRTLAETEAISSNVTNNLMVQRNQLESVQGNLDQTQEDTVTARGHLRRLTIKAVTSKFVLILVILGLIAAIAVVSYYKWYPRTKKDYLGILPPTPVPAIAATPAPAATPTSSI